VIEVRFGRYNILCGYKVVAITRILSYKVTTKLVNNTGKGYNVNLLLSNE
jgi:hypothetical protein